VARGRHGSRDDAPVTDAWFDVLLSNDTSELLEAIGLAAVGELPLALSACGSR
jgi:hypothetical protein